MSLYEAYVLSQFHDAFPVFALAAVFATMLAVMAIVEKSSQRITVSVMALAVFLWGMASASYIFAPTAEVAEKLRYGEVGCKETNKAIK